MLYRPPTTYACVVFKTTFCELKVCYSVCISSKKVVRFYTSIYWIYQNSKLTFRMAKFLSFSFMSLEEFLLVSVLFQHLRGSPRSHILFSSASFYGLASRREPSPLYLETGNCQDRQSFKIREGQKRRLGWEPEWNPAASSSSSLQVLYISSFYLWGSVAFSPNILLGQLLHCT